MDNSSSDQLKVLVVDDDELNQRMMNLILTREGHHVHIARDGVDAISAVREHEFDIILMDLQMPNMGGVEASRKIRDFEDGGRGAYIVALTASYLPEKGQELFDAGIDNYIAKPFDVEHLRLMLNYGLDHRKLRQRPNIIEVEDISVVIEPKEIDIQSGIIMVGGDEETYRELLTDFVEKLPEKTEIIGKFYLEKDMDGLARIAHNIKGVSSNLGALQLYEYADSLEKCANEGYTSKLESSVREIKEVAKKFIKDASNYLATPQSKTNNS